MQLLLIHADLLEYWVKAKIKALEGLPKDAVTPENEHRKFEECLGVFTSVEKKDAADPTAVARAVAGIKEVFEKVNAKEVVLYPYAHLSSELARPREAMDILVAVEEGLKAAGVPVARVPFGSYKQFHLHCKGHPLSELSKKI